MGQAYEQNPMMSPGALLAVGGIGAGAGEARPQWNERRMAAAQIPILRQSATDERQLGNYASLDESRKAAARARDEANANVANWRNRTLDVREQNSLDRMRQNWYKSHPFFDATKATDADKDQLAKFGETPESIGTYDYKDPKTIKAAGSVFQYDRNKRAWVDQDALKDPSQEPVAYSVYNPATKQTQTFYTTSARAAGLVNHLTGIGMQVDAANARQQSQQEFQGGQQTQRLSQQRDEFIKNYELRVAENSRQNAHNAEAHAQWLQDQIRKIQEDSAAGKLDPETRDQMLQLLK